MVTPYNNKESKKQQVAQMFNGISKSYDFLNHFFSMGIDILWRKKAIRMLKPYQPQTVLDLATGTADFAFEALALKPKKIIGMDISEGMLDMGRIKVNKRQKNEVIELLYGDSENLPLENNSIDVITIGFGVRNFENLDAGLGEMVRVLRPGGAAAILEFSKPRNFPIKQLYGFYFHRVMPILGKIVSKDSAAYTYLPESVEAFPEGKDFINRMSAAGFKDIQETRVSGGIATIYLGKKY
ncbi:MAG TPA: bifunctional demethylmenaquinone methyltransferase/2-methoxy-6-polyprenyl-1,4-benzoquinol methylase UbiE [Luteibaculaceae bacterium]|jgi:demethylmenaquinone methyltransferase / 2-methoxy-6-polyprenyl-1,4-benzoquinol methylase|nr:bifunctional demethylmenaquinone methyltransferase/2-methoxy-6-polyprenyl-1,4-benzoquinol methylase UbiE [Luteibaculaceae bacterium]